MALSSPDSARRERIERVLSAFAGTDPTERDSRTVDQLCQFLALVELWNAKTDLTAARSPDELVDLFIADAAHVARASASPPGESWIDVGSGAGAPGLPLALLRPDLRVCLLEPKQKRVAFLRTVVGQLRADHISVERGRSQDVGDQTFDISISRATLPPEQWLAEGARLATRSVWLLLAKAEAPVLVGWEKVHDETYRWPLTGAERRALRFERRSPP